MSTRAQRVFNPNNNCCNGRPPYWTSAHIEGAGLTQAESYALQAIEAYGGTYIPGHTPYTTYEQGNFTPEKSAYVHVQNDAYGPPYDASLPPLTTPADLPDDKFLFLTNVGEYKARQIRQMAKQVTTLRIVRDASGMHSAQILWCDRCESTAIEQFLDDLSTLGDEFVPVVRVLAAVCSYVPVLGTAVSFVLNAAVDLAQGETFSSAMVDAIGHALPGQPVTGEAFDIVRGLVNGDRVEDIVIDAALEPLGVGDDTRTAMKQAVKIVEAIANGEPLTKAIIDQVYGMMPDAGKHAMDIAQKILDGENIPNLILGEGVQAAANAARSAGEEAKQKYIMESGYYGAVSSFGSNPLQDLIDTSPQGSVLAKIARDKATEELKNAFTAAITLAKAEKDLPQNVASRMANRGFDTSEKNTATLDQYAAKGRAIMSSPGAVYHGRQLMALRNGKSITITMPGFDGLSGQPTPPASQTFAITPGFVRGFDVGIGTYEGVKQEDAEKQDPTNKSSLAQNELSLNETDAKAGFRVARTIQFERTRALHGVGNLVISSPLLAKSSSSVRDHLRMLGGAPTSNVYAPVAMFQEGYVSPVIASTLQQKEDALAKWTTYYVSLGQAAPQGMAG